MRIYVYIDIVVLKQHRGGGYDCVV